MKLKSILLTVSRFIIENIASFLLNIAWFCLPPHEVQTCQKQLNTLRNHIYRFLSQLSMVSLFDSNISNNGINIDMSSSLLQKDWFLNGNILEAIYTPQSHTWDCALACLSMIFNLVHLNQSGEQSLNNNKEFNMNNKYSQSNDFIDLSLPNSNISTTPTTTNTTTINARCGVYSLSRKYDSPLWTVDIFYELQRGLEQRLGLELHEAHPSSSSSTSPSSSSKAAKQCVSEYCTAYAGVRSEHYTRYEWYGRQQSDVDRVRVQEMFELCHRHNWTISYKRLSIEALVSEFTEPGTTAVILVDKTLLLQSVDSNYNNQNIDSNNNGNNLYINASTTTTSYQSHRYHHIGSDNSISSRIGATSQFSLSTHNSNFHDTFTGHFIYLLGYTMSPDFQAQITATPCVLFHYLDPARPKYGTDGLLSSHTVCSTVLDSARCHSGTDEDIIFIRLK